MIEPNFEELSCYLDGELPADRLAEIDQWLEFRPDVRNQLQKIRAVERRLVKLARASTRADAKQN